MDESRELDELRARLADEERAYAELLAKMDALVVFSLPFEARPDITDQLHTLNDAWPSLAPPIGWSPAAIWRRSVFEVMSPSVEHQTDFNAILVQILNGFIDESAKLYSHLRTLASVVLRHTQTILPVMDSRDRVATALATTRAELILEAFDRRQEALGRRLEGLLAVKTRLEAVEESLRGTPEEIRARFADYVPHFRGQAPVLDLGGGRGEFLELLRAEGIEAVGVDASGPAVLTARADGSCGGVFAAQVVEHLAPAVLTEMLRQAYRVLRPGGAMVLEVFNRDLTHQRPLHPDTLSFLAAAAGFKEVRVELRSPVDPSATLQPIPTDGLPAPAAAALNENVARLNALLYGPQDYALFARR